VSVSEGYALKIRDSESLHLRLHQVQQRPQLREDQHAVRRRLAARLLATRAAGPCQQRHILMRWGDDP